MKFFAVATAMLALASIASAIAAAKPKLAVASSAPAVASSAPAASTSPVASASSTAAAPVASQGPYSAACKALQDKLLTDATYSGCRTLIATGIQAIAVQQQNNTSPQPFLSTLQTYCAKPRCADSVYKQVFQDLKTTCSQDLATVKTDTNLAATVYQWYLSVPQHDAICTQNGAGYCWTDIITSLNSINFLPWNLTSQKDLFDYTNYFLPITTPNTGMTQAVLCQECLVKYANIFNAWYVNNPSIMSLSQDGLLNSTSLQQPLTYVYQHTCSVILSTVTNSSVPSSAAGSGSNTTQTTASAASGSPSVTPPNRSNDATSVRSTAFCAIVAVVVLSVMMV
ncbi:hypothetical protein BC936DRAFT_143388 [Jimgerdemannia flammicorona]|uniref:Uncharacterized protein n=2 Tax=Jimgerdemannia flammicorona TaxID=994334 RepID=A0A432ZZG8_9FUNG|nr:hypothetical protein BC936DRAFT_143388 [Jimgerdemannia flammicorona]RUS24011.1 hypothetical protein BC938DRAFT_474260 [Jimgerdemannia flammicorona]